MSVRVKFELESDEISGKFKHSPHDIFVNKPAPMFFLQFLDPPILYSPDLDPDRTYRVRIMDCDSFDSTGLVSHFFVPLVEFSSDPPTTPVAIPFVIQDPNDLL